MIAAYNKKTKTKKKLSYNKYTVESLMPHAHITNHYSSAHSRWRASIYYTSLFVPEQQSGCSVADSTAMSDAALIEKLINFLKSSAVILANQTPVWPHETNFTSALNGWGPSAWLHGNIWSLKVPFIEYCLIKVKLRELYAEFNFCHELLSKTECNSDNQTFHYPLLPPEVPPLLRSASLLTTPKA